MQTKQTPPTERAHQILQDFSLHLLKLEMTDEYSKNEKYPSPAVIRFALDIAPLELPTARTGKYYEADSRREDRAQREEHRKKSEEILFTVWQVFKEESSVSRHGPAMVSPRQQGLGKY